MTEIQPKVKRPANKLGKVHETQDARLTLTQEIIDDLAAIVRKGNFRYVARGKLGIPRGTFESWISSGKREHREVQIGKRKNVTLKMRLVTALDIAENDVHAKIIEDVLESDNLKLKMDYLYRRYGKLYAKNPNAHDDETGETVKIDPLELLADKLRTFIKEP